MASREEFEYEYTRFVEELQSLPDREKKQTIDSVIAVISATLDYADNNGFLYEMLTEWPNGKINALEASIATQMAIGSKGGFSPDDLYDE